MLGQIGFAGRFDYSAIGTIPNTAARLCQAAANGEILITPEIAAAVSGTVEVGEVGPLALRGISRPLVVYNVLGYKHEGAEGASVLARQAVRAAE